MRSAGTAARSVGVGAVFVVLGLMLAPIGPAGAESVVEFSKAFSPDVIGPGSTTTLTFTIANPDVSPVSDLAFTDVLPPEIVIATPARAQSSCEGDLTLPDNATITLSGGRVGAFASCSISVDVTSSTPGGPYTNTSGDLTSSAGNSGPASANLTVDAGRPGILKSFTPPTISPGETSVLTLTIDNFANTNSVENLVIDDFLPPGMVVATPSNATTDCESASGQALLTADPGGGIISLRVFGSPTFPAVGPLSSCSVTVDVTTAGTGTFVNTTDELLTGSGLDVSSGFAGAVLEVPRAFISKTFTDDPVLPGDQATLRFTLTNLDRAQAATAIGFTDDLGAALTGLEATAVPASPCGAGSSITGTGVLSLSGGTLAPEASCTFEVTVLVPGDADPGTYTNTTSPVTYQRGGTGVVDSPASATLVVAPLGIIKEFINDPVAAGGTAPLRFTITNAGDLPATDVAFEDEFNSIFATASAGPDSTCGGTVFFTPLGTSPARLSLSGGSLAAGASCTIDITLDVRPGVVSGIYPNTTGQLTATIGTAAFSGKPATDEVTVLGAPALRKDFIDSPVEPGDTVTLEFTLVHDELAAGDATAVTFTDDLTFVFGLTAVGLPMTDLCGPGNGTLSGSASDTLLTASGITLTPGQECTFAVTLQVGAGADVGTHTNTTSELSATVLGLAVTGNSATDDLIIAGLVLTKEFTDDPVIPGGTVTLQFTLDNLSSTETASSISFQDDLDAVVGGLAAASGELPASGCGGTLLGSAGDTFLLFFGGSLAPLATCSFSITLDVPAGAASDTYLNTTSGFQAVFGGSGVSFPNATDTLVVDGELIELDKEFTDDPVAPGDTANLRFTITNLDAGQAMTAIAFTDNLGDAGGTLAGLAATGLPMPACGGTLTGTTTIALSGASLPAGGSCTFDVSLSVPAGAAPGTYPNTTSQASGTVGGLPVTGSPATDTLRVTQVEFTKAFSGPAVAGDATTLTFTIQNLDTSAGVSPLQFSDDLEAMLTGAAAADLPKTNVCGPGSQISGTGFVTLTGASLGPGGSCTFDVTVSIPAATPAGIYDNETSDLISSGVPVAEPATASLAVTTEADLSISKTDAPDPVKAGKTVVYTVTVNNAGPSDAAGVVVTDTLPSELAFVATSGCAEDPGGYPTCTLGTIPAGGSAQYTLAAMADLVDAVVTNAASVSSAANDPDAANNTTSEETRIFLPARIGNQVFRDVNGDGINRAGDGDVGIPGVTVELYDAFNNLVATRVTDADGVYRFGVDASADWVVKVIRPAGLLFTARDATPNERRDSDADAAGIILLPASVLTPGGDHRDLADAGLVEKARIGNQVFHDVNGDGVNKAGDGDVGVPGVTVELYDDGDNLVSTRVTDANGVYRFGVNPTRDWTVKVLSPAGFDFTAQNADPNERIDSDADPADGTITLSASMLTPAGDHRDLADAGLVEVP